MAWLKIWLVARREYLLNFRRPSFLLTAFGVPLLSLAAMFFVFQFTDRTETNLEPFQRVGYIDHAGIVTLAAAPDGFGFAPIVMPGLDGPAEPSSVRSVGAFRADLEDYARQQLVDGELHAFFVIDPDYVLTGQVDLYTRRSAPRALIANIERFLSGQVAAHAPADLPVPVERLTTSTIVIRDLDTGDELDEAALLGRVLLPFIFVLIYFMATSTTAQFLMSGVVEEKEDRLMEILATSMRPQELLWGKLLGLGGLALTQVALWAGAGVAIASTNETAQSFVTGVRFAGTDIALIGVLFVINFLLFSAAMLSIGVSVTAEAESRQFAGVFTFIAVLPIMLLMTFFNDANGPLPVALSFFPFTAAVALILRIGLTAVPAWQIALSIGIQAASVLAVMWLAARVFRLGMLMYGKPLTPRAFWTALRQGRTTLTSAAAAETPGTAGRRWGR